MKYEWEKGMGEISGFGGGYEEACRTMLIAGLEWLDEHPDAVVDAKEYTHIYGILADESPDCEEMGKAMLKAVDNDATGAMYQATVTSVIWISKHSWEEYVKEMSK